MSDYKLLINGQLVDGDSTMEVINPATEQPVAACARASKAQLDQAVAAAKAAFPAWSKTSIDERRQVLVAIADAIQANIPALARLLTQEQGKPLQDAMGEVFGCAAFFRYFASLDLKPQVVTDTADARVEIRRRPLGVVGAIVPWNFPLVLMAFKVPAALLAGNTVVLKPAGTTPLSTLKIGALIKDLLPPGVLNIIADANDLGGEMTKHPDIRKISFTGSTETGKKVMAGAADALKRVSLELGGNDALIVLDDVDPKATAPKVYGAAMQNAGQVCIAAKRIYVHESIYDAMCDELAKLASEAVVGDGLEQGTQMGPLQNRQQFEKVLGVIESAKRQGDRRRGAPRRQGLLHPAHRGARYRRGLQAGGRGAVRPGDAGDQIFRSGRCDPPGQRLGLRPGRLDMGQGHRPGLGPGGRDGVRLGVGQQARGPGAPPALRRLEALRRGRRTG